MPDSPPGKGFFYWLGRQVGYVARAVKTPVAPTPIYEQRRVHEQPHPADPSLTLRRTITDEVVKSPPTQDKSDTSS